MPQLTYRASNFPNSAGLNGTKDLSFTWAELVWSAITVGRSGMRKVLQYGAASRFEIIYRAALLYANLEETVSGTLRRSDAYDGLDPSEKSAISYFLGLTLSKLFAERCLNVPWLLHLDIYRSSLKVVLGRGRSRPDLVGQDTQGRWVVIESKGRTNALDSSALARAKQQARRVSTIDRKVPKFKMGVQAYFESSDLRLAIDDPQEEEKQRPLPNLSITSDSLTEEYYRPFMEWVGSGARTEDIGNREFAVREAPELDMVVGLDTKYRGLRSGGGENLEERQHQSLPGTYIGNDGVFVRLGPRWGEEIMRQAGERRN